MSFIMVWISAKRSTCYAKHDNLAISYKHHFRAETGKYYEVDDRSKKWVQEMQKI